MDNAERLMFLAWSKRPQFNEKVNQSLNVIEQALAIAPAYVACSWGKDSISMLHLVQQLKPEIPVISFGHPERELISNYADVEQRYCHAYSPSLTTLIMQGDHVPDKLRRTELWKTYPLAFVGLRKEESDKRSISISKYGLIHQFTSGLRRGTWRCCPLGWWGWKDVWAYIVANNLPYLDAYDLQSKDRGRTTDHLSKTVTKTWQQRRLSGLLKSSPDYYHYLKEHYPEMFY